MKFSSVNHKTESLQRRERWRRDHAAARTLASAFPQVERVCINLRFANTDFCRLAPQSHVLHGPAQAFFDFPCPYADCHGHFDLAAGVADMVAGRKELVEGSLDCAGMRFKAGIAVKESCLLRLDYSIAVRYR